MVGEITKNRRRKFFLSYYITFGVDRQLKCKQRGLKMLLLIAYIFSAIGVAAAEAYPICLYDQYRIIGESKCQDCPMCPKGSGLNVRCSKFIAYHPDERPHCVACIDGKTYSSYESRDTCSACSLMDHNQREVRACTKFQDRLSECNHGIFEDPVNHKCIQQCCYCDGRTKLVTKCEKDKMTDGMFCAPTRWDGKCDNRMVTLIPTPTPVATIAKPTKPTGVVPVTPTPVATIAKPTKPTGVVPVTENMSSSTTTSVQPTSPSQGTTEKTTNQPGPGPRPGPRPTVVGPTVSAPTAPPEEKNTHVPVKPTKETESKAIVIGLGIAAIFIVVISVGITYRIRQSNNSELPIGEGVSNSTQEIEAITAVTDKLNSIVAGGVRGVQPIYQRVLNQSAASSARSSQVFNTSMPSSTSGSRDPLLTPKQGSPSIARANRSPLSNEYSVCGICLSKLRYLQRRKLAMLLDPRGEEIRNNWLDIGLYIAGVNEFLRALVERCHGCYYGGGIATMEMFNNLAMTKPDLTVYQFLDYAHQLQMSDVIHYIADNIPNNISKFVDIPNDQKEYIANLLEKRVPGQHNWVSLADLLGFDCNEIEYFKIKKIAPRKYSPTLELIMVLIAHRPQLTVEELQTAAVAVGRADVKEYLSLVIHDITHNTYDSW